MKPTPLQPGVRDLIVDCIDSVAQLQVLLRLSREPERTWSAIALSEEVMLGEPWTAAQLQQLVQMGLAARVKGGTGPLFRFGGTPAMQSVVAELGRAYQSHPVAVVTLIYTKPNRALQNFSDAFRLRKDETGPGGGAGGCGGGGAGGMDGGKADG